jgi:hypothetical protein
VGSPVAWDGDELGLVGDGEHGVGLTAHGQGR